jgi:L-lactate dehydrogenase complex protein LldG
MSESSREAVLARIRQGLAAGPAPLPPRPDFAAPVHPPLSSPDVVVAFAERFQQIGGEFHYCETLADLAEQLAAFRERQQVDAPYVWEPDLQAVLQAADIEFRPRRTAGGGSAFTPTSTWYWPAPARWWPKSATRCA